MRSGAERERVGGGGAKHAFVATIGDRSVAGPSDGRHSCRPCCMRASPPKQVLAPTGINLFLCPTTISIICFMGGAAARGHVRAHTAAFVCDASARGGRVDPVDLGVSRAQLAGRSAPARRWARRRRDPERSAGGVLRVPAPRAAALTNHADLHASDAVNEATARAAVARLLAPTSPITPPPPPSSVPPINP